MLHDLVAKGRAQHLRLLQRLDRLAQGLRHVVQLLAAVGVAEVGLRQLQLLLDAGEAGRQQRREGEIGVEVAAADAALDADRLGALAAEAEAGGAVVEAPDRLGRREGAGLETLVGIHVGRQERSEEHTSELQSLMRNSYAVISLKKTI